MDLHRALAKAKRIEDAVREKAFLPVLDEINGVVVQQMTLRHLTILFAIGSPFVYGGVRQIEDVGMFLWIVSPHYNADNPPIELKWWWRLYYRLMRKRIPTLREAFMLELVQHPRWSLFYRAINRYIYFAFLDRPPTVQGGKIITASYAAATIHRIATAYHWSKEEILDMPIGATFQFLKWVDIYHDSKTPQFRPLQARVEARHERIKESRLSRGEGLRHGG